MSKTLLASAARTASNVGSSVSLSRGLKGLIFILDVTAAAKDVGDTLNVYVQESPDGSIWTDRVSFNQVLGNGGAEQFLAYLNCELAPTTAVLAPQDAALAAASLIPGPIAPTIRAKFVIGKDADVPEDQSFTFSLKVLEIR